MKSNKLFERSFLQKAVEGYAEYKARSEEATSFALLQTFLEDLATALKDKGINKINGQNYTLYLGDKPNED